MPFGVQVSSGASVELPTFFPRRLHRQRLHSLAPNPPSAPDNPLTTKFPPDLVHLDSRTSFFNFLPSSHSLSSLSQLRVYTRPSQASICFWRLRRHSFFFFLFVFSNPVRPCFTASSVLYDKPRTTFDEPLFPVID